MLLLFNNHPFIMAFSDSVNNSLKALGTTRVILFLLHPSLASDIMVQTTTGNRFY